MNFLRPKHDITESPTYLFLKFFLQVYHKQCFTCAKCTRYIDSLIVNVGPGQCKNSKDNFSQSCKTIARPGSLLWDLLQEGDCSREASGDDGHDGDHGIRGHGREGHLSCVWRKGRRSALSCHSAQLSVYLQVFEAEKMIGKYGIYHQAG